MRIAPGHLSIRTLAASVVVAVCLLLAACGEDDGTAGAEATGDPGQVSALPAPEGATGSVTGMPANPGPGTMPISRAAEATPGDQAMAIEGSAAIDQGAPIDGVFVLDDAPSPPVPSQPPAPPSPTGAQAAYVQPADSATRAPPAGTEAATESTTFVVEPALPAEPED